MRKSDRKTDNALRKALTEVCELALEKIEGFAWLTHQVNFDAFPASLKIVCVFETNRDLANVKALQHDDFLKLAVKKKLSAIDIILKNINQHLIFDTEEDCAIENNDNWKQRLN